jgi:hypothetical protein
LKTDEFDNEVKEVTEPIQFNLKILSGSENGKTPTMIYRNQQSTELKFQIENGQNAQVN